jgi:hypothetical protein
MRWPEVLVCTVLLPVIAAGCAAGGNATPRPQDPVEAVGKVVDSLAGEAARRATADGYRGLPVVVAAAGAGDNAVERIIAEFLRTRLHERGMTVQKSCAGPCLEITLQEFATSAPGASKLTPGQILTVATGSVPILGSLTRSLNEREREIERAAARTTGLLVTFAARDGERFTARSHVIAIVSAGSGDVALEQK